MASGCEIVDCVVVGAGPAGAHAARLLGGRGARVVLLEKAALGRDKPCGGGLTARAQVELDRGLLTSVARGSCGAAMLRYGPAHTARIALPQPIVLVRRREFDRALTEAAADAGVEVRTEEPARAVDRGDGSVLTVQTDRGSVRTRTLLIATGAEAPLRSVSGLTPPTTHMVAALEIEAEAILPDAEPATFIFDYDVPAGFAWAFPKGQLWNVGVGSADRRIGPELRRRLDEFIAGLGLQFRNGARPRAVGRRIPISTGRARLARGRVALVGDAAGLADPLIGEGIGEALASARLAADAVHAVLDGARDDLVPYSRAVYDSLGQHLRRTRWAARAFYARPRIAVGLIGRVGPVRAVALELTQELFREPAAGPVARWAGRHRGRSTPS